MYEIIQHLCEVALLQDGAGLTDGQLLERLVDRREEAAAAALVRRHGPMVWAVCRRVLRNYHDAEDAFQATFLVLIRKANSIVLRQSLASWLYRVAHQVALNAKKAAVRRTRRERQTAMPESKVVEQDVGHDLQLLLLQELRLLADKYRAVLVLCHLQGKTRAEAARLLGVPEGTVASRMATARKMLAKRLTRHGLAIASSSVAALLSQEAVSASVPALVVCSSIKAVTSVSAGKTAAACLISANVAALTEGVVKSMLLMKLKNLVAALLMVVGAVAFTGGMLLARGQEEDRVNPGGELLAPAENTAAPGEADVVAEQLPNDQKKGSQEGKATEPIGGQQTPPKQTPPKEDAVVREIRGVGFRLGDKQLGPQEVPEPTVFTSAKAIWEAVRFPAFQKMIDQVDFAKDQVMVFSYKGSGNDGLSFRVERDKKEPVVVFFIPYSDRPFYPELHFHIYLVPKTVKWRVEREKENPKGKDAPKKGTDEVIRRLDLTGYKGPARRDRAPFAEPTTINNADELAKAIPDKEWQNWIAKRVDFAKEQLVFFAYASSGTDSQAFKIEKEENEPIVIFFRRGGFHTSDLRPHFHLFAVDKKVKWRAEPNRVPR